ncbi:MAG: hypothetical protein Q7T86_15575 [Hyphomicrobiaceae bacterium]|nr:hypothetical protein [Hyphomicrobiaceae bacterium]
MKPIAKRIIADIVDELYGKSIMSNLIRPIYIERLLRRLLDGHWRYVGADWAGWDLENSVSRVRVEVKQSAARQTWSDGLTREGKETKPIFDIKERSGYYSDGGAQWVATPGRPADIYIFAWHPLFHPIGDVDHTDPEQWEFHLLAERLLPKAQKTISLSALKKLGAVCARSTDLSDKLEALLPELQPLKWVSDQNLETPLLDGGLLDRTSDAERA